MKPTASSPPARHRVVLDQITPKIHTPKRQICIYIWGLLGGCSALYGRSLSVAESRSCLAGDSFLHTQAQSTSSAMSQMPELCGQLLCSHAWPPKSNLANLLIHVFLFKQSTFCYINGHPKQYILVDTIFNYRFHFGLPGKCL